MLMPSFMPDHDDAGLNVAGWMDDELFHPDFALQAVKPYPDLEEDIKRAMRSEPTPPHPASNTPSSESGGQGGWINVCSVLIADTKRLQIKRLRLRRRSKKSMTTAPPAPSALSAHRHLHPPAPQVQEDEDEDEEECLDEEVVCDVDDVLATAVEGVIAGAADEEENVGVQVCKCMVLGALENVVKAVAVGKGNVVGNVLTEGVAKWLSEVEEAATAAAAAATA